MTKHLYLICLSFTLFLAVPFLAEAAKYEDGLQEVAITPELFDKMDQFKLFTFMAPDLPKSTYAIFTITKMDGKAANSLVYLDDEGHVMTSDEPTTKLVITGSYGYGESVELQILPSDNRGKHLKDNYLVARHHFVPHPLEVSDDLGHKIALEPMELTGKTFVFLLSGFEPGETVKVISRSCEEVIEGQIAIDKKGSAKAVSCPGVIGKVQGPFELTVQGKNMKPLTIQHYWGRIAFTPTDKYQKVSEKYPNFDKKSPTKNYNWSGI